MLLPIWRPSDALSSQHLSDPSNGISDKIGRLKSMPTKSKSSSPRFGSHCDSASEPSLPQSPPKFSPAKEHGWSKTKNISDKNSTICRCNSWNSAIPTAKLPLTQIHSKTLKIQHIPHHFPCLLLQIRDLCLSKDRLFHLCQGSNIHVTTQSKLGGVGCLLEKLPLQVAAFDTKSWWMSCSPLTVASKCFTCISIFISRSSH